MSLRYFAVLAFCTLAFSAYAAEPQAGQAGADLVDVAVPLHDVARGDVLQAGDLGLKSVARTSLSGDVLRDVADIAGHEARRAIRANDTIRATDVRRPVLVAKGANVTMIFDAPGISLSETGRAMGEGGIGETIAVLNPVSYRQISATVIGPGAVRVGSDLGAGEAASQIAMSSAAVVPSRRIVSP